MKYYGVNTWNAVGTAVHIIFGFDTKKEAVQDAKQRVKRYRDQTFTGLVVKANNCNEANAKMDELV